MGDAVAPVTASELGRRVAPRELRDAGLGAWRVNAPVMAGVTKYPSRRDERAFALSCSPRWRDVS